MPRNPRPSDPLSPTLRGLARDQQGLLTAEQLRAAGVDRNEVRRRARAGLLHPVHRGIWSSRPAEELPVPARVTAARLLLDDGTACLHTAARLWGVAAVPPDPRVHLSLEVPAKRRQISGIARHWLRLTPGEVTVHQGVPCTTPSRTILDASRRWHREDVIALVDGAVRAGVVDLDALGQLRPRLGPRARAWLDLADGRAESPLETRLRLVLHDAGLAALFEPQWEVRRAGTVLARIDFAVPSLRLGIECDGRGPHELPAALFRDRSRADDLAALGWRLFRVTWDDVVTRPDDVIRRIRRALAVAA